MADTLAVTLLKRLQQALEKVPLSEGDDLSLLEINLKHLRDAVHPATKETVADLLATGASKSAGHVILHHLSISGRVLGAETLALPAMGPVRQLTQELRTESEAMIRSGEPGYPRSVPMARVRPTMTDVLSAFVLRGRDHEPPATMATESRS